DGGSRGASRPPAEGSQEPRLGPGRQAVAGTVPPPTEGRPAYKLLRYDEDWSLLKDPARRTDFWDPLKYIPLGTRDAYYLTVGGDDLVTWRLGRQEFEYGTGRLIDVREGPNLRLAFDATRVLTKAGGWSVDGWWAKPVRNNPGTFDDDPNPAVSFWGVYGVRP